MNLLTCEKVSLGYGSGVVVKDLSFKVGAGDYLCIIGENGAGKSTLVKTLLGLQKPLGVTITLNVTAGEVGYLPQQTQIQKDFPASVEEIILSGCLARKKFLPFYSAEDKKLCADNMERLGISTLAHNVSANFQADNNSAFYWQGLCARREKFCCSTNRLPD